jgi:hypothetical protein
LTSTAMVGAKRYSTDPIGRKCVVASQESGGHCRARWIRVQVFLLACLFASDTPGVRLRQRLDSARRLFLFLTLSIHYHLT